jgi:hypothetical protein
MATARCSMSTARRPDKRSRMIEAGLTGVGAAEAGQRVQGLLPAPTGLVVPATDTVGMPDAVAPLTWIGKPPFLPRALIDVPDRAKAAASGGNVRQHIPDAQLTDVIQAPGVTNLHHPPDEVASTQLQQHRPARYPASQRATEHPDLH